MAVPTFGWVMHERLAYSAVVVSGVLGLVVGFNGDLLQSWTASATWHPGRGWLVGQSVLVIGGGLGACRGRSFTLAVLGTAAGLVSTTPVGQLSILPAIVLAALIALRSRGFPALAPRWRGRGPIPPGFRA